jgi:uncharacterized membrane protein
MNEGRGNPTGKPRMRKRWLVPLLLLLTIWAVAFSHYPRLPHILPGYFQLSGEPTRWVPKGINFFALPLLAGAVYFILGVVGRLASRRPSLLGRPLYGEAARNVGIMLRRYIWLMNCAILAFILNIEFRSIQIAYGTRQDLGWDSYLLGGLILGYAFCGSVILFRFARRCLRWQEENDRRS